jgi:hypothetical protein
MSAGNEYLTSNTYAAYPFRDNAAGLALDGVTVHGASAKLPLNCFVDALLLVPSAVRAVYLASVEPIGPLYRLTFKDQNAATLYTYDLDWSSPSTDQFTVISIAAMAQDLVLTLAVNTAAFTAYLAGITTGDIFDDRLPFEARAVNIQGKTVQTFELYTALPLVPAPTTPGPISGDVRLESGYNIEQDAETDADIADLTNISIDAVPGAGVGVAPCQQEPSAAKKGLMALVPDESGNMQIRSDEDGCYTVIPHISIDTIEIQGTCVACCSCQDYANVTAALNKMLQRSKTSLTALSAGRSDYETGVTKFNNVLVPAYNQPVLRVNGMTGCKIMPDLVGISGSPGWATLSIAIHNNSNWPIELIQLDLGIVTPAGPFIRKVGWEYAGKGGSFNEVNPVVFPAATAVARGARYALYVLAHVDDFTATPTWTGTAILTLTVKPTNGDPDYPLTLTASYNFS